MPRTGGQGDKSSEDAVGRNLRRHSAVNPRYSSPHSENVPRLSPSMDHLPSSRTTGSAGPSPLAREFELSPPATAARNDTNIAYLASSTTQEPPIRHNRFSLLKFRHASDPQLSTTYAQTAPPPVPLSNFPPSEYKVPSPHQDLNILADHGVFRSSSNHHYHFSNSQHTEGRRSKAEKQVQDSIPFTANVTR
jgi:hypothetical protein